MFLREGEMVLSCQGVKFKVSCTIYYTVYECAWFMWVCIVFCSARAFNNMQTGQGPSVELKPEQLLALKAGGHSVQELTG